MPFVGRVTNSADFFSSSWKKVAEKIYLQAAQKDSEARRAQKMAYG